MGQKRRDDAMNLAKFTRVQKRKYNDTLAGYMFLVLFDYVLFYIT